MKCFIKPSVLIALSSIGLLGLSGCSSVVDSKVTRSQTYLCNTTKVTANYFSDQKTTVQLVISGKKHLLKKTTISGQSGYVNTAYIWKPEGSVAYLFDKSKNNNMACAQLADKKK